MDTWVKDDEAGCADGSGGFKVSMFGQFGHGFGCGAATGSCSRNGINCDATFCSPGDEDGDSGTTGATYGSGDLGGHVRGWGYGTEFDLYKYCATAVIG